MNWQEILQQVRAGQTRAIARAISLVENEMPGYEGFMQDLPLNDTPVIGITGPPGAGKSTLTDALIGYLASRQKKVAVLCVDPSSPFGSGAILGDRIRMSAWYNHPGVFIRSLASRGQLGGLHPKMIEITDILKASPFDYILAETVGVGQSEMEIAGLADITVVVMVPESGDEIQVMKAGLVEIADIFVVNKSDRPGADAFAEHLQSMLVPHHLQYHHQPAPVIKTVATRQTGIDHLMEKIHSTLEGTGKTDRKYVLLAEKAWQLILHKKMQHLNKLGLAGQIKELGENFQLYRFISAFNNGE